MSKNFPIKVRNLRPEFQRTQRQEREPHVTRHPSIRVSGGRIQVNLRAEVRMKGSHSIWTKYQEASEVIDLHGLFNDYWSSNNHKFTMLGQSLSPTGPCRSD